MHFKKVAANFKYSFEEISTLLCSIEACLNSRSLCLNTDTASEEVLLTSNHLLERFALMSPAEDVDVDQRISIVEPMDHHSAPSNFIYPTCQLSIWVNGQAITIRALLDPCCGMKHIVQRLPTRCGLKQLPCSDSEDIQLIVSPKANLHLRLPLVARVVRRLPRPTFSVSCPPPIRPRFYHMQLADPDIDQPGALHMIIGMPTYNHVMRSNTLTQPGFPQAQDSIFGLVLSGVYSL